MKKIDINTINQLLDDRNITKSKLSLGIELPLPNLSMALNGKRPLSMNYVFDIANFFNVDAESLTKSYLQDNNTAIGGSKSMRKEC